MTGLRPSRCCSSPAAVPTWARTAGTGWRWRHEPTVAQWRRLRFAPLVEHAVEAWGWARGVGPASGPIAPRHRPGPRAPAWPDGGASRRSPSGARARAAAGGRRPEHEIGHTWARAQRRSRGRHVMFPTPTHGVATDRAVPARAGVTAPSCMLLRVPERAVSAADHLRARRSAARGRIAQAEQSAREADRAMAIASASATTRNAELAELFVVEDRAERERRKRREGPEEGRPALSRSTRRTDDARHRFGSDSRASPRGGLPPHLDGVIVLLHTSRGLVHVGSRCAPGSGSGPTRGRWWAMDCSPAWGTRTSRDPARAPRPRRCGLMLDAERPAGWRGRARCATTATPSPSTQGGLDPRSPTAPASRSARPCSALLAEGWTACARSACRSPTTPDGRYDPDYHQGARRPLAGPGAQRASWLGSGLARWPDRHRTPEELRRHMAGVPADVDGVGGWYARLGARRPRRRDRRRPAPGARLVAGRPRDARRPGPPTPAPAGGTARPRRAGPRAPWTSSSAPPPASPTHPEAAEEVARAAERIAE